MSNFNIRPDLLAANAAPARLALARKGPRKAYGRKQANGNSVQGTSLNLGEQFSPLSIQDKKFARDLEVKEGIVTTECNWPANKIIGRVSKTLGNRVHSGPKLKISKVHEIIGAATEADILGR